MSLFSLVKSHYRDEMLFLYTKQLGNETWMIIGSEEGRGGDGVGKGQRG